VSERDAIVADLLEQLRFAASLSEVGLSPDALRAAAHAASALEVARSPEVADSELASVTPPCAAGASPAGGPGGASSLEALREHIGDCQRCKLAGGRNSIVFGQGHPDADLMFVGEAPGADEDEQGLAFVGRAGQLLTRIIEAIELTRDDVFIANVLKCRPPQNRNPEPDEIRSCQPFLERQIELIRPKVLVGLGKFAGQWLLRTAEPISKIRGRVGKYNGIDVIPTYHPAYLLRNPGAKKEVWEDMKLAASLLGIQLQRR
jgi:DNA polymerase